MRQEFVKRLPRSLVVAEVLLVNLADGEKRLEAVLAAGILAAQELVFVDGRVQVFFPRLELAAHLRQQFSDGNHAGVRLAGIGRHVINLAVGVGHALVVAPGPLRLGTTVQGLAHLLGLLELIAGPLLARSGVAGERARACADQQQQYRKRPEAQSIGAVFSGRGKEVRGSFPGVCLRAKEQHWHALPEDPQRKPQTQRDREGVQSGGDLIVQSTSIIGGEQPRTSSESGTESGE